MSTALKPVADNLEALLIKGDLSSLTPEQRVLYYNKVCESVGLNPLTQPFEYMLLNGKLVLYAKKSASEQLRMIHKVSITVVSREAIGDVYVVTARASILDRQDESTGAVYIANLKGDTLANAYMKAETKAKRRVTLSICGLAILDDLEVDTIPGAKKLPETHHTEKPKTAPPAQTKPLSDFEYPTDTKEGPVDANALLSGEFTEITPNLDYVIPLGSFSGKKLKDIPLNEIKGLVANMERGMPTLSEALKPKAQEMLLELKKVVEGGKESEQS